MLKKEVVGVIRYLVIPALLYAVKVLSEEDLSERDQFLHDILTKGICHERRAQGDG